MANDFTLPPKQPFALSTGASATPSAQASSFMSSKPAESFDAWLKASVREFPVTLDLPPEITAWIGTITAYWALAEWIQAGTLVRLLGTGRKEERVVLGHRLGNCVPRIKQLLEIKGVSFEPAYYQRLTEGLTPCENARNLLAHGVWLIDPDNGSLCVQDPSGDWNIRGEPKVSKRKYPEAFPATIPWFEQTLENIKTAIRLLQQFDQDIDAALATLREKGG